MPKIRFNTTRVVQDGSGTTFIAGQVYDLPQASCDHWTKRGVAEVISDRARAVEPVRTDRLGEPIAETANEVQAKAEAAAAEARTRAEAEAAAKAEAERLEAERIAAEQAAAEAERLAKLSAVAIPSDWAEMPWQGLRALASSLTDQPIRNKDEAGAAIEAELKRRAG